MEIVKIKEGCDPSKDTIIEAINTNADALMEISDAIKKIVEAINKLNENQLFG